MFLSPEPPLEGEAKRGGGERPFVCICVYEKERGGGGVGSVWKDVE